MGCRAYTKREQVCNVYENNGEYTVKNQVGQIIDVVSKDELDKNYVPVHVKSSFEEELMKQYQNAYSDQDFVNLSLEETNAGNSTLNDGMRLYENL